MVATQRIFEGVLPLSDMPRLRGALADQPSLLQPGQRQVKKPVRPPVLFQQPLAEVTQHAVVEAGIVQMSRLASSTRW